MNKYTIESGPLDFKEEVYLSEPPTSETIYEHLKTRVPQDQMLGLYSDDAPEENKAVVRDALRNGYFEHDVDFWDTAKTVLKEFGKGAWDAMSGKGQRQQDNLFKLLQQSPGSYTKFKKPDNLVTDVGNVINNQLGTFNQYTHGPADTSKLEKDFPDDVLSRADRMALELVGRARDDGFNVNDTYAELRNEFQVPMNKNLDAIIASKAYKYGTNKNNADLYQASAEAFVGYKMIGDFGVKAMKSPGLLIPSYFQNWNDHSDAQLDTQIEYMQAQAKSINAIEGGAQTIAEFVGDIETYNDLAMDRIEPDRAKAMAMSMVLQPDVYVTGGVTASVMRGKDIIRRGSVRVLQEELKKAHQLKTTATLLTADLAKDTLGRITGDLGEAKVKSIQTKLGKQIAQADKDILAITEKLATKLRPPKPAGLSQTIVGKTVEKLGASAEWAGRGMEFLKSLPRETAINFLMKGGYATTREGAGLALDTAVKGGSILTIGALGYNENYTTMGSGVALMLGPRFLEQVGRTAKVFGRQSLEMQRTMPYWKSLGASPADNPTYAGSLFDNEAFNYSFLDTYKILNQARQVPKNNVPGLGRFIAKGMEYVPGNSIMNRGIHATVEGLSLPMAIGYATGGPEGMAGGFGIGGPIIGVAGVGGQLMRFKDAGQLKQRQMGDLLAYEKSLSPAQLKGFRRLLPEEKTAIAEASTYFPDMQLKFINDDKVTPGMQYVDPEGNGVVQINMAKVRKEGGSVLGQILAHEIGHHVKSHGLHYNVREILFGDVRKNRPGWFTERDENQKPIMVKDKYGHDQYKTNAHFQAIKDEYVAKLKKSNVDPGTLRNYQEIPEMIGDEYFAEMMAHRILTGKTRKTAMSGPYANKMASIVDGALVNLGDKLLTPKFFRQANHSIGNAVTIDGSKMIFTNKSKDSLRFNKEVDRLIGEYERRTIGKSSEAIKKNEGDLSMLQDTNPNDFEVGPKDYGNLDAIEHFNNGGIFKTNPDGTLATDMLGKVQLKMPKEQNAENAQLANDVITLIQKYSDSAEDGHITLYETKDGSLRGSGRFLDERIINELTDSFNPVQLDILRRASRSGMRQQPGIFNNESINPEYIYDTFGNRTKNPNYNPDMAGQDFDGPPSNRFLMMYYKAMGGGRLGASGRKYKTVKGEMRDTLVYGITVTKDKNIIVDTFSQEQITKNVQHLLSTKGRLENAKNAFGIDNPVELAKRIQNDLIEFTKEHKNNVLTGGKDSKFTPEQKQILNASFGALNKRQIELNPLLAGLGEKKSQRMAVTRSRRLDRIASMDEFGEGMHTDPRAIQNYQMPMPKQPMPDNTRMMPDSTDLYKQAQADMAKRSKEIHQLSLSDLKDAFGRANKGDYDGLEVQQNYYLSLSEATKLKPHEKAKDRNFYDIEKGHEKIISDAMEQGKEVSYEAVKHSPELTIRWMASEQRAGREPMMMPDPGDGINGIINRELAKEKNSQSPDYHGVHRAPGFDPEASGNTLDNLNGSFPDIYGPEGLRYYGNDIDNPRVDQEAISVIKKMQGDPDGEVMVYRAVPEFVDEINPGDWVAITEEYARDHGDRYIQGQTRVLSKSIKAKELYSEGNSIQEFGWDPGTHQEPGAMLMPDPSMRRAMKQGRQLSELQNQDQAIAKRARKEWETMGQDSPYFQKFIADEEEYGSPAFATKSGDKWKADELYHVGPIGADAMTYDGTLEGIGTRGDMEIRNQSQWSAYPGHVYFKNRKTALSEQKILDAKQKPLTVAVNAKTPFRLGNQSDLDAIGKPMEQITVEDLVEAGFDAYETNDIVQVFDTNKVKLISDQNKERKFISKDRAFGKVSGLFGQELPSKRMSSVTGQQGSDIRFMPDPGDNKPFQMAPGPLGLNYYHNDKVILFGPMHEGMAPHRSKDPISRAKFQIFDMENYKKMNAQGKTVTDSDGYVVASLTDEGHFDSLIDIRINKGTQKKGLGTSVVHSMLNHALDNELRIKDIQGSAKKFWQKIGSEDFKPFLESGYKTRTEAIMKLEGRKFQSIFPEQNKGMMMPDQMEMSLTPEENIRSTEEIFELVDFDMREKNDGMGDPILDTLYDKLPEKFQKKQFENMMEKGGLARYAKHTKIADRLFDNKDKATKADLLQAISNHGPKISKHDQGQRYKEFFPSANDGDMPKLEYHYEAFSDDTWRGEKWNSDHSNVENVVWHERSERGHTYIRDKDGNMEISNEYILGELQSDAHQNARKPINPKENFDPVTNPKRGYKSEVKIDQKKIEDLDYLYQLKEEDTVTQLGELNDLVAEKLQYGIDKAYERMTFDGQFTQNDGTPLPPKPVVHQNSPGAKPVIGPADIVNMTPGTKARHPQVGTAVPMGNQINTFDLNHGAYATTMDRAFMRAMGKSYGNGYADGFLPSTHIFDNASEQTWSKFRDKFEGLQSTIKTKEMVLQQVKDAKEVGKYATGIESYKNWVEPGIKRSIHNAVRDGHERYSILMGEDIHKAMKPSEHIDGIEYTTFVDDKGKTRYNMIGYKKRVAGRGMMKAKGVRNNEFFKEHFLMTPVRDNDVTLTLNDIFVRTGSGEDVIISPRAGVDTETRRAGFNTLRAMDPDTLEPLGNLEDFMSGKVNELKGGEVIVKDEKVNKQNLTEDEFAMLIDGRNYKKFVKDGGAKNIGPDKFEIEATGLDTDAQPMRQFYDNELVKRVNKVGKKFGLEPMKVVEADITPARIVVDARFKVNMVENTEKMMNETFNTLVRGKLFKESERAEWVGNAMKDEMSKKTKETQTYDAIVKQFESQAFKDAGFKIKHKPTTRDDIVRQIEIEIPITKEAYANNDYSSFWETYADVAGKDTVFSDHHMNVQGNGIRSFIYNQKVHSLPRKTMDLFPAKVGQDPKVRADWRNTVEGVKHFQKMQNELRMFMPDDPDAPLLGVDDSHPLLQLLEQSNARHSEAVPVTQAVDKKSGKPKWKEVLDDDDNPVLDADGNPKMNPEYEVVDYDLQNSPVVQSYAGQKSSKIQYDIDGMDVVLSGPQKARVREIMESGALDETANRVEQEITTWMEDPAIKAGDGWYSRMRKKLATALGTDHEIFSQLLGATSARTPVETNFIQAREALTLYKNGSYDNLIKTYMEGYNHFKNGSIAEFMVKKKMATRAETMTPRRKLKNGTVREATYRNSDQLNRQLLTRYVKGLDHNGKQVRKLLIPLRANGKKYNANSGQVMRVIAGNWLTMSESPKTPNFAGNLTGRTLQATIDVWAGRMLRRKMFEGEKQWRIQPASEGPVGNVDFALGQIVFAEVAKRMGKNPDDLQAVAWFGEKDLYGKSNWTSDDGAFKSSFDEPMDIFFPDGQEPRKLKDGVKIIDYHRADRSMKKWNATIKDPSRFLKKDGTQYTKTEAIDKFNESKKEYKRLGKSVPVQRYLNTKK